MDWCNNCGLCCCRLRTPPFYGEGDETWQKLRAELKKGINDFLISPRSKLVDEYSPCFWLDVTTGRCKNYEHRPDICRDFEVGNAGCREFRSDVGLTVEGMPVVIEE